MMCACGADADLVLHIFRQLFKEMRIQMIDDKQQQAQIGNAAGPPPRTYLQRPARLVAPTTTRLVREFAVMGIEDLNVRGMMATEKLARSIADIGFYEFRRQLEYKARLHGAQLVTASRWFPSSKICCVCGRISEELPLSIREWTCECGTFHDRDINAARNLRRNALDRASCARINACGEEGSGAGLTASVKPASLKQESGMSYLGMD